VKRGEIWVAAGGGYLSKPRPAVVLQADAFPAERLVTVCPLTSDARSADAPLLRVPVPAGDQTGLQLESWAMVDKITTVRAESLGKRMGAVPAPSMPAISRATATFLGLAD
jgi:mRNA interferase MazF